MLSIGRGSARPERLSETQKQTGGDRLKDVHLNFLYAEKKQTNFVFHGITTGGNAGNEKMRILLKSTTSPPALFCEFKRPGCTVSVGVRQSDVWISPAVLSCPQSRVRRGVDPAVRVRHELYGGVDARTRTR